MAEGKVKVGGKVYSLEDAKSRVKEALEIESILGNTLIIDLTKMEIIPLAKIEFGDISKIIRGEGRFIALKEYKEREDK